jgi:hypothetical protein
MGVAFVKVIMGRVDHMKKERPLIERIGLKNN